METLFYKGHVTRIYPDDDQKKKIDLLFSAVRKVYNLVVETCMKEEYPYKETIILQKVKTRIKDIPLSPFYQNQVMKEAFQNCVDRKKEGRELKFRNWYGKQKLFLPVKNKEKIYDQKQRVIDLGKIGLVSCPYYQDFIGIIRYIRIVKDSSGDYFVSVATKEPHKPLSTKQKKGIGIDLNIKPFIATSDGKKIDVSYQKLVSKKRHVAKLQKKLSRKKKGSKNFNRLSQRISKVNRYCRRKRADDLHKQTHALVKDNTFIAMETLAVDKMRQDRRYASSLSTVAMGEFTTMLEYKTKWNNRTLEKVDTYYPSSKTCHVCGYKNQEINDLSIREWDCPKCHIHHDRDVNAAINILEEGKRQYLQKRNKR